MKKYNITRAEKYVKDGVEKTAWKTVGEMVEFEKQDGTVSRIIEIPAIGLKASVFEQKPKEYQENTVEIPVTIIKKSPAQMSEPSTDYPKDDISPEDIPF